MDWLTSLPIGAALLAGVAGPARAQEEITAPGPQGELRGTLVPPAAGQPLILILPGSGPTDRDGNNPLGVIAAPYRLLAEALAEHGIGTLRIDKRGMFGSKTAVADPNAVTVADYVADVESWVEVARARTGRGCVWLLGHSEGGVIALAAAEGVEHLCGLMLVAAPGRPLGLVLRQQLQANPANAPVLEQALAVIDRLEKGEKVDVTGMHPGQLGLFAPQVQGYLIDLMAQDPAALAAATPLPLLIVQGGKDLQVPPVDGETLRTARPDAVFAMLPHMNHVLRDIPSDQPGANQASYGNAALPVAPALVDAIVGFVTTGQGEE